MVSLGRIKEKKVRVLLIEDDMVDRLSFERLIEVENLPYNYSIAGSISEAKEKLTSARFDVIVSDYSLGDGNAFDVLDFQNHAPVVMITGAGSEDIAVQAMKRGAYDYIAKDLDRHYLKVLPVLIEKAIERRKLDNELQKHRDQLTVLVDERTQELHKTNIKLKREMAERKKAEAEAIRSTQLAYLGELAAGVAHEVNNPINGIINYAQILVNKLAPGSKNMDIAERIIKEGDRIANLVSSLLLFATDASKEKGPASIHNLVFSTLTLTQAQLKNNGIILEINVPSNLPPVNVNYQQIEQVFLNIVINARYALNQKYPDTHKDKILGIHAESITVTDSPCVRITFHDRGEGIQKKILDKIVDPFFSTKPMHIGTGLGLSISHGIISNHGGRIKFESVEKEFTKVIIDLPVNSDS